MVFLTLMYHLVDRDVSSEWSVPQESFVAQMHALCEMDVNFLNLRDVSRILDGRMTVNRGVLVTFDDGYRNTVGTVLPILEAYGIPATVSLCSSYLFPGRPKETPHVSQDFAYANDIYTWLATGRDIAGHTYDHPDLSGLSDCDAEWQIAGDQKILEKTFNRPLDAFFYPFGLSTPSVRRITAKYYGYAFGIEDGEIPSAQSRYNIKRQGVYPRWSIDEFRGQVSGGLAAVENG